MIKRLKNNLGVTLFELTVSILVGSIVLVTLMSVLTMTVKAKMQFDYENRMLNESYIITETLKSNLANLLEKEFTIIQDDTSFFVLQIDYCDVIAGVLDCSENVGSAIEPYKLVYNKTDHILSFGVDLDMKRLHSSNIFLIGDTQLIFTRGDVVPAIGDPNFTGELLLIMNIQIQTTDGVDLEPKSYTTKLLFTNYN